MQSRDNKRIEENRDLELEKHVGNLLITEYQTDKLRTRLADLVDGFRPKNEIQQSIHSCFQT
jgi:hypothetical protein